MNNIAKYTIDFISKDNKYTRYHIIGLKEIYYDNTDVPMHSLFNGASCLVKASNYPGYCVLCASYYSNESEQFENGFTIHYVPLYDQNGKIILIKYDYESFCTDVLCARNKNFDTKEYEDAQLIIFNNGFFEVKN